MFPKHSPLLILFFFVFFSTHCTPAESSQETYNGYSLYEQNKIILERSPEYLWNENKTVFHWGLSEKENPLILKGGLDTKGSAGLIPYVCRNGEIYVLLSRETWGRDKNKYCDLGGAVEAYVTSEGSFYIDSFLQTLLKECKEESGGLYEFSENEILNHAHIISHRHNQGGSFHGFESIIAFHKVNIVYFTEQFISASQQHAEILENLHLCPWGYQEKNDYQWIELSSLYYFLTESQSYTGIFKNISEEMVTLQLRNHLVEILRSEEALDTLSAILREASCFTFEDETCL